MVRRRTTLAIAAALVFTGAAPAGSTWCLGMGGLGPIRAGMGVEDVLRLADWPGFERKTQAMDCWYLPYSGNGADFRLMIIKSKVVRIEITGHSQLHTFAGAHIGSTEEELTALYGARLDIQPDEYDAAGHTITLKSGSGEYGLRFETSSGKVTAIEAGPWEHLNYFEGCG